LAGAYSSFYNADKVMVEDTEIKARRLLLCARTRTVLMTGLELLGIKPLERM
jgi:arginyl-tRNA synthetase